MKTIIFSLNNGYIYTNAAVIMTMAFVVIKKCTHYMSIVTKTMTKFLKSLKKTTFVAFST